MKNDNQEIKETLLRKCYDMEDEEQKYSIATVVAMQIQDHYGSRWEKCVEQVMQSSWWESLLDVEHVENPNIDEITASVIRQIDNNEIL